MVPGEAHDIRTVLGPGVVPAVDAPVYTTRPPKRGGGLVAGVEIGGDARAYPLNVLAFHQLVNVSHAGLQVAVTYDPLCRSVVVFDRDAGRGPLKFTVSGKLLWNNMLLRDIETGSLWGQIVGRALEGPLAGRTLKMVPVSVAPWELWRSEHPATLFMEPPNPNIDYGPDLDPAYSASHTTLFPRHCADDRLHPKELVAGVRLKGGKRAYPLSLFSEGRAYTDSFEGEEVALERRGESVVVSVAGLRLPATTLYWFAWIEFHPDTTIWSGEP